MNNKSFFFILQVFNMFNFGTIRYMIPSIFNNIISIWLLNHRFIDRTSLYIKYCKHEFHVHLGTLDIRLVPTCLDTICTFVIDTFTTCLFLYCVSIILPKMMVVIRKLSCFYHFCNGLHRSSSTRDLYIIS